MITKTYLKTIKQCEIAALLDYSERRIQQLHDDGLPRNGTGRAGVYDWTAVMEWRDARISGSGQAGQAVTDRQRKDKADADMAEMERDQAGGDLIDAGDARREWIGFLGRLKDNLLGLADRCSPELEDGMTLAERIAIIRRHVNGSLRAVVAELQAEESLDA